MVVYETRSKRRYKMNLIHIVNVFLCHYVAIDRVFLIGGFDMKCSGHFIAFINCFIRWIVGKE